jgi:DNA-binding CsgD family transcriptional regulator
LAQLKLVKPSCRMDTKRFSALIEGFYGASAEPHRWQEAATQMARFLDSESAVIQVRAGGISTMTLRFATANYDDAAQQAYVTHFYKHDPAINGWRTIGRPGIFGGRELVDYAALRNSEFYIDHLRRIGVFYPLCAILRLDADTTLMLGIHRPIEREDFSTEHRRCLELAAPHLLRAVQTHQLLATADLHRRVACEVLDGLSVSAIVVDRRRKVVFANAVADQSLREGDGLAVRYGRLTTSDPRQESAFHEALRRASQLSAGNVAPPGGVLSIPRTEKRPLSVMVAPFRGGSWVGDPAGASAIVFANDPDRRRPPPATALASLYNLTRAEARLLDALLQGEQISEFAERVGVSANTAKTQLRQLFAKTGTNRQSELMRQMYSDPVVSFME